jgi:hypothetical protein
MKIEDFYMKSAVDPLLEREGTEGMVLVLDLTWDRLAWGVYDPDRSQWLALERRETGKLQLPGQLLDKVREIRDTAPLLQKRYSQMYLLWGSLNFTLMPEALLLNEKTEEYLRFTNTIYAGDTICRDSIGPLQTAILYTIPALLKTGFEQLWPGHKLVHRLGDLIQNMHARFADTEAGCTLIDISAQSFSLLVIRDKKLQYCNSFEYRTSEDLLYYVLYTLEQLGIQASETELLISGDILKPSIIADYLEKYMGILRFIDAGSEVRLSPVLSELPIHLYYPLMNFLP